MATWNVTVGDLYPPYPGMLYDTNGPVSLASSVCSGVQLIIKGPTNTISGAATIMQVAFTANTTSGSAQLSAVSAFTNIWGPGTDPWDTGSTIFGPGIPAPVSNGSGGWTLPTVLAFNSGAQTITMSQPASVTATGVTLIANLGTVWYPWATGDTAVGNIGAYKGGWQATWTSGSKPQFFPSDPAQQVQLSINALP